LQITFEYDGKSQKVGVHPQTLGNVGAHKEFPPGKKQRIISTHNLMNAAEENKQMQLHFRERQPPPWFYLDTDFGVSLPNFSI
jgi:hypothetical protein